jgi:Peptidoglycan-synthase activator LpoB
MVLRERNSMHRREWFTNVSLIALASLAGCRGYQYAHVINPTAGNLVGSHEAGAEVFDPLVDEAVAKLLARQQIATEDCPIGPDGRPAKKTICFIGIDNKSVEDIGDFKDKLYNQIDSQILESHTFQPISRRMVDAALHETRMRPDSLMVPENLQLFTAVLQRGGAPVDYFLYATLTSGTTKRNSSTQRDYELTLELTNIHTGEYDKTSSEVRKGYHKSAVGKFWNFNPLKR